MMEQNEEKLGHTLQRELKNAFQEIVKKNNTRKQELEELQSKYKQKIQKQIKEKFNKELDGKIIVRIWRGKDITPFLPYSFCLLHTFGAVKHPKKWQVYIRIEKEGIKYIVLHPSDEIVEDIITWPKLPGNFDNLYEQNNKFWAEVLKKFNIKGTHDPFIESDGNLKYVIINQIKTKNINLDEISEEARSFFYTFFDDLLEKISKILIKRRDIKKKIYSIGHASIQVFYFDKTQNKLKNIYIGNYPFNEVDVERKRNESERCYFFRLCIGGKNKFVYLPAEIKDESPKKKAGLPDKTFQILTLDNQKAYFSAKRMKHACVLKIIYLNTPEKIRSYPTEFQERQVIELMYYHLIIQKGQCFIGFCNKKNKFERKFVPTRSQLKQYINRHGSRECDELLTLVENLVVTFGGCTREKTNLPYSCFASTFFSSIGKMYRTFFRRDEPTDTSNCITAVQKVLAAAGAEKRYQKRGEHVFFSGSFIGLYVSLCIMQGKLRNYIPLFFDKRWFPILGGIGLSFAIHFFYNLIGGFSNGRIAAKNPIIKYESISCPSFRIPTLNIIYGIIKIIIELFINQTKILFTLPANKYVCDVNQFLTVPETFQNHVDYLQKDEHSVIPSLKAYNEEYDSVMYYDPEFDNLLNKIDTKEKMGMNGSQKFELVKEQARYSHFKFFSRNQSNEDLSSISSYRPITP